jgi:glycosyltransferase involved in cell wall biosynthesis
MSLRILNIIHNLEIGGAQSHLLNLATEPNPAIERQAVVCWKRGGPLVARLQAAGVDVTEPRSQSLLAVWRSLVDAVERVRPHVLHAHMSDSSFWAARLASRFRLPFVVTFQDGTRIVPEMAALKRRLRRWLVEHDARRAAMNIGVSESLRTVMLETLGVPADRVMYIPNCIRMPDENQLAEADAARKRTIVDAPRILALGRYVTIKGFDQLIAHAPRILARWPGAQIDIVGTGPLAEDLKRQAESLGVTGNVHVTGPSADPASLIKRANLFVSTSHYEGTSLALLEAMSWRLPVVVSNVPGNRDVVRDGHSGVHYELNDGNGLVAAIASQLSDRERASRLAAVGREEVDAEFSARAVLARHVEIYGRGRG